MISSFMSLETPNPGSPGKPSGSVPGEPQQPPRETDVYDLLAWFELNKGKVAAVALLLVALGFGIAIVRYTKQLRPTVVTPTNQTPPQASAFLRVAEDFSGTRAAERAKLFAATTLFSEGKYAEAQNAFNEFLAQHRGSQWAGTAELGVAAALEAQGKTNEALAAYQTVANTYANTVAAEEAKLAMGRLYEARQQPEQALRLYNELAPANPMMPGRDEAASRREALFRQYPHLNTNRPAMTQPAIVPGAGEGPTLSVPTGNLPSLRVTPGETEGGAQKTENP
jgi:tetratricopeptide (TPR) repeat protein